MASAMNGIALHGGLIPYGGTFLTFADYSRPAIRLAALMGIRVIHVMTHDSIGLGEDGPTHQPVEHLASLRAIPNLLVFRPGDAVETAEAWDCALRAQTSPSLLCLSRQAMPTFRDAGGVVNLVALGAYVIVEPEGDRDVTLIATGSEVSIALKAAKLLASDNVRAAVVSAPCFDLFRQQSREYRASVLGSVPRIGVEAAVEGDWARWLGDSGEFVGMTGFGASAPAEVSVSRIRDHGGGRRGGRHELAWRDRRSRRSIHDDRPGFERNCDGTNYAEAIAGPRRRARLWRAGLQHQQYGAGARDHGGGGCRRCAGHHAGLPRRAVLCQRYHAGEDDRCAGGNVSADPALHASGSWQRGIDLRHRAPARLYFRHDGRLAQGRRQDRGGL